MQRMVFQADHIIKVFRTHTPIRDGRSLHIYEYSRQGIQNHVILGKLPFSSKSGNLAVHTQPVSSQATLLRLCTGYLSLCRRLTTVMAPIIRSWSEC